MVYNLLKDNSLTYYIRQLYYDCLGRDPLYSSFYLLSRAPCFVRSSPGDVIPMVPDFISSPECLTSEL
jgi:hypothetical protein